MVIHPKLDLQLPVQLVLITTKVVSLNLAHGKVYSIQHYVIKFISNLRQVWFSLGPPVSSTNKTDRYDINEMHVLLKVALNCLFVCCLMVFNFNTIQQYFSYLVAISFIGGGNWRTRTKPQTCRKSPL